MVNADNKPNEEANQLSPDQLGKIYDTLLRMIECDGAWIWNRWHYLLLANSFLFGAVGAVIGFQAQPNWLVVLVLSYAGGLLCTAWHLAAIHGGYYHDMWIRQARTIEERLTFGEYGPFTRGGEIAQDTRDGKEVSFCLEHEKYSNVKHPWAWRRFGLNKVPAKDITGTAIPLLFAFVWLVLFVLALLSDGWLTFVVGLALAIGTAMGLPWLYKKAYGACSVAASHNGENAGREQTSIGSDAEERGSLD